MNQIELTDKKRTKTSYVDNACIIELRQIKDRKITISTRVVNNHLIEDFGPMILEFEFERMVSQFFKSNK